MILYRNVSSIYTDVCMSPLPPKDSVNSEAGCCTAFLPFLYSERKYNQANASILTKLAITPIRQSHALCR